MSYRNIGQTIYALRKHTMSLTQEKLAEKANISSQQLSRIEGGDVNSSIEVVERLAQSLGVTIDYLLNCGASSGRLHDLLDDCNESERAVIISVAHATKTALKHHADN